MLRASAPFPVVQTAAVWMSLLLVLLASGCDGDPQPAREGQAGDPPPVTVAATVPPLAWLAEAVGGDAVEVTVIVPPGAHAEHYEPSPRRMIALAQARVVLAVGHPALGFEGRFLEPPRREAAASEAGRQGQIRLTLADTVPAGRLLAEDPHLWASPKLLAELCTPLADALARLRPEQAGAIRQRAAATRELLTDLDRELARRFAALPRQRFWVAHPAWGWLAREYNLEQVALERHGRQPGPAELVRLLEEARREGVTVLFVQPGSFSRQARALAEAIGARVETLDPLAADWPANLRRVADALEEALAAPPAATHSPETPS